MNVVPPEHRKIQKTGGNSFVVSLPKTWVKSIGLKKQDTVAIIEQSDSSLVIIPSRELREASKHAAIIEVIPGMDKDALLRHFISFYLAGYDSIRINLGKSDVSFRVSIREGIRRKLVGV